MKIKAYRAGIGKPGILNDLNIFITSERLYTIMERKMRVPLKSTKYSPSAPEVQNMAANQGKTESTPTTAPVQEIEGIKGAVERMTALISSFEKSVQSAQGIEQSVVNMRVEINKKKDDKIFAALLAATPGVEEKMLSSVAESSRKEVNERVVELSTQMRVISELTAQIKAKYGKLDAPATGTGKGGKSGAFGQSVSVPNIDQAVLDAIDPVWKTEHNFRAEPIPDTKFFRVFATGHTEGTIYKSNIRKW